MKTEVEFTIRFTFDPTKPVKFEELLLLERAISLIKNTRAINPADVPDVNIGVLEKIETQAYALLPAKEAIIAHRKRLAERALEANKDSRDQAAKMLGVSRACFYRWLRGEKIKKRAVVGKAMERILSSCKK